VNRRPNPVYSPEYRALIAEVRAARVRAGITQRALAARLGKAASHVSMIEKGQRRLDSLEFYLIARALSVDATALFRQVAERLDRLCVPGHQLNPGEG